MIYDIEIANKIQSCWKGWGGGVEDNVADSCG